MDFNNALHRSCHPTMPQNRYLSLRLYGVFVAPIDAGSNQPRIRMTTLSLGNHMRPNVSPFLLCRTRSQRIFVRPGFDKRTHVVLSAVNEPIDRAECQDAEEVDDRVVHAAGCHGEGGGHEEDHLRRLC